MTKAWHFVLLSTLIPLLSCGRPHPADRPSDVTTVSGPEFTIKVSTFPEKSGGFVPGVYYRFESLSGTTGRSVSVMQFRHDDDVPIPRENIRFLGPKIAFLFMGWKYAVTTDGGTQWHVWNAETDLPEWQCCNYGLIRTVELSTSGAGKMVLKPIAGRRGEVPELVTSDFGRHWLRPT